MTSISADPANIRWARDGESTDLSPETLFEAKDSRNRQSAALKSRVVQKQGTLDPSSKHARLRMFSFDSR